MKNLLWRMKEKSALGYEESALVDENLLWGGGGKSALGSEKSPLGDGKSAVPDEGKICSGV